MATEENFLMSYFDLVREQEDYYKQASLIHRYYLKN